MWRPIVKLHYLYSLSFLKKVTQLVFLHKQFALCTFIASLQLNDVS